MTRTTLFGVLAIFSSTSVDLAGQTEGPKKKFPAPGKMDVPGLMARLDGNSDGKLSKSEAKGPLAGPLFERIDQNKDGFLDRKEIQLMQRYRERTNAKSAVDLFNQQDADADGRLTVAEAKQVSPENFAAWDGDKNGQLSRQEFEINYKQANKAQEETEAEPPAMMMPKSKRKTPANKKSATP